MRIVDQLLLKIENKRIAREQERIRAQQEARTRQTMAAAAKRNAARAASLSPHVSMDNPVIPYDTTPTQMTRDQMRYEQLIKERDALPIANRRTWQEHSRFYQINQELNKLSYIPYANQIRKNGIEAKDPANLGTPDTFKHFRGITSIELYNNKGRFTQPISVVDIETGHKQQPISLSVLKGVIDRRSGEFRVLDTMEKYYTPRNAHSGLFGMSRETHGLTPATIAELRRQQGNSYGEFFDTPGEKESLLNLLKGSVIVGQNTDEFDFRNLGIEGDIHNMSTLDTLVAAENMGIRRGKEGLKTCIKPLQDIHINREDIAITLVFMMY